jgi:predicted component of type VI protein secretion system
LKAHKAKKAYVEPKFEYIIKKCRMGENQSGETTMHPALEKRIRESLGPGISLDYVENLLNLSAIQTLEWIRMDMERITNQTIAETIYHFSQNTVDRGTVDYGLMHLHSRLKLLTFLAKELQEKVNAVDAEETSSKLQE